LIPSHKYVAALFAVLAGTAAAVYSSRAQPQAPSSAPAQLPAVSALNHNLVLLDPAHGGPDSGATLDHQALEKNITLALAAKLRATLTAAGFTVLSTRDSDLPDLLTPDQRAETANRAHAVACIVLHATSTGSGVHVYTSTLAPENPDPSADPGSPPSFAPVPWETAQAAFVTQSEGLLGDLNSTLGHGNLPALTGKAPLRPLDNLMCPAVAVEIAPLANSEGDPTPVTDGPYQQRVADALTAALNLWRTHADPPTPQADDANPQSDAAAKAMAAAEAAGRAASRAQAQQSSRADQKASQ
jgi:N-acetylmuramoyl-L-alanine amidase